MSQRDWQGRDVPEGETPETEIKWWVVDNISGGEGDEIWIRGWQDMLSYVADHLDVHLESFDEDELTDGIKIGVKLRTGTKALYDEVANDSV